MMKRIAGIIAVILLAVTVGSLPAYSQNTKKQEAKREKLQREIAILDGQIKANATKSANALNQLALIRKRVDSRKELVAESDREISEFAATIQAKERQIAIAQARLDTLSDYYDRLVRGAYKNRNAKVWYMYIIASDNLGQAFRRYGYLRDLSKQMSIQAGKIRAAQDTLRRQTEELAVMKKQAETLRGQRVAEMSKLQSEESASQNLVNQLKKDKKKYQQDLAKKQKEVEALNREIERLVRKEMEARKKSEAKSSGKSSTSSAPSKPVDYTLAKQFEAIAAVKGGAPRIELCSALELDGLTPSWEDLRTARALYPHLTIHVLIRPRPGDFCYSPAELQQMAADIRTALSLGADGIVIGCLTPEGDVDIPAMQVLMADARNVTFHRAFDVCRQPFDALEAIIGLGCSRLLTSGQAPTVTEGTDMVRALREQAAGRIGLLPGCGVTPRNARRILELTGCTEIHASASHTKNGRKVTSARTVAAILRQINAPIA